MTPNARIAVTGMGVISSIGNNVAENLEALRQSKHGIHPIQRLETHHNKQLLAGEVFLTNKELYERLGLPLHHAYSRTTLLAIMAAKQALRHAAIDLDDGYKTGLVSASTVGGMDATERFYDDYLISEANRHFILTHPCGHTTEQLASYVGIDGFMTTVSTACSSSANAIMLGARMIKAGILDRVIVGGSDSLARFTVNGFHSLMIYSDEHCTPFDEDRKGLNLGEGAAFIVLESRKIVDGQRKKPIAYLSGYGNANDAFHQTASSDNGEGAYLAMCTALEAASLMPADMDYINAHGTATPNNDLSEGKALLRIYGKKENLPKFSSTKAFTGHTLAAAGAIEAVFSILALAEQATPPNLNFSHAIAELDIIPETQWKETTIRHVLSNSLGFGGNCSSLIFSKADD